MSEQTIVSDDNSAVSDSETTKYDEASFKKLLGQRKADKQKADELASKLKEVEEKLSLFTKKEQDLQEQKLQEQGNFKALLEQREKELKKLEKEKTEAEKKVKEFERNFTDMRKLNLFFDKIGGKLKQKEYLSLVETEKIAIDPESGEVDEKSLSDYASEFLTKHKPLVAFKSAQLPNEAGSTGKSLSYQEWVQLAQSNPAEARKRYKEVIKT
jgi:hypothetical protein